MKKIKDKKFDLLLIEILILTLSFIMAYTIYTKSINIFENKIYIWLLLMMYIPCIICYFVYDLDNKILNRDNTEEFIISLKSTMINFIFIILIFYIFKIGYQYSRITIALIYLFYFSLSFIAKTIYKNKQQNKTSYKSLMLISNNKNIENQIRNITNNKHINHKLYGICVYDEDRLNETIDGVKVIANKNNIIDAVTKNNIEEVYITIKQIDNNLLKKLLDKNIKINIGVDSIYDKISDNISEDNVSFYKTIKLSNFEYKPSQLVYFKFKRVLDIIFSMLALIPIGIALLIIKIIYLLNNDKASIFYKHIRIGLNGKPFYLYKIRTMIPNAEDELKRLLKDQNIKKEWDKHHKLENDPRITKIGNILRKTSLDELPQFINVLKGEMSIIGPRPLVPNELESHGGSKLYQKAKPGITGWWACNGRSNIAYDERLELEYYYVKNCSFSLDVLCFLRTIVAVFKKTGAK